MSQSHLTDLVSSDLETSLDGAKVSRPPNYFALIYADGNRMGETIRRIGAEAPADPDAKAAGGSVLDGQRVRVR